ncbi:uroporphyrinogen-III C-methyltransferase [Paenibacillus sp. FSL M7-1455]|uniref:uroporphyrinogen-III C-methyltransferase n=1 Tax=Paenibacillus sp. FSL M7-1455 TaxID=2975316 RepID=UPI0030FB9644
MKPGSVSIVGAGPGDPELITLKALRRIQEADVILYDRLANKELLKYAKEGAMLTYCGKAPGRHAVPQEQIHELLAAYAMKGLRVVRLKGGDPLVFGRGGEEAQAMAALAVPCEIVPGLTSALGAAASAGIPLTHRGLSSSVAFVSGTSVSGEASGVRWDLLARGVDTLVVYMGVGRMEEICRELIVHGKPESAPAAVIEQGTCAAERIFTGTVGTMFNICQRMQARNPALLIVGDVVRVREQLLRLAEEARERIG